MNPQGTAREVYMKELSENPNFQMAPESGQTFCIVGARPNRNDVSAPSIAPILGDPPRTSRLTHQRAP